jgi:hypothetical protein
MLVVGRDVSETAVDTEVGGMWEVSSDLSKRTAVEF